MPDRTAQSAARRAFTLVEILVVIIIVGIAAMVVVPQVGSAGTLSIQAAARRVIADLLVAQNEAIARGASRSVIFDVAGESYRMVDENGATVQMAWMNGPYVVSFADDNRFDGVAIDTASFGTQSKITFDDLGAPSTGGTIDLVSGSVRYRVTVAPFTGRVTVAPVTEGS